MDVIHDIVLNGYVASLDHLGPLTLGTYGSRDIEKLRITLANGWDGMDVQVVFHPSGIAVMLPKDGLLDVPWEATSRALGCPDGAIVFQGFDGTGKLINTIDIAYKVLNHSPAEGKEEQPATPGIVEAVITQMKADKDAILNAAEMAEQSKNSALISAENAERYSESASESLRVIQETELTSLNNANLAAQAATQAATSASNAKQSETNAHNSATQAATSASNAKQSETNAHNSATQAATSSTNASNSAIRASNSADEASGSASDAKRSETNTANIATQVAISASEASNSASDAKQSETNAHNSATQAATSSTNASNSAIQASNSAINAATSSTNAKQSEINAATSASNAKQSETNAADSALNAAASSTNAKQSEINAANSATNAKQSETNASDSAAYAKNALEQIKSYSPEFADALFGSMLDGTNTTKVFWSWWPVSEVSDQSKYDRLCRFADMAAKAWSDKTYTLRSYRSEISGESAMTPLDDLTGKSPAQLCTEAIEPVTDWADEDPMTWYIRANALSKADGTMDITHIEGEDGFDITGETAPVYTFALALWIREWSDENYDYISFRTAAGDGFYPDAEDIAPDNTRRPITWHPTFPGSLNSVGALTSGAGLKPYNFASGNTGIVAARKMTPYEGLWCDCDTIWLLRMWQLRHFDLENSNICNGCVSYNFQYQVAAAENGVRRVLLTSAQANNFLIGSIVSIGDPVDDTNYDRNRVNMRNIAEAVKIESITDATIDGTDYKSINLLIDGTIDVTSTTWISTWPWFSGDTENLPGHKDGCTFSLTAGKTPIRVAGVEVLDGSLTIGLDPLYRVTTGSKEKHFTYSMYSCKDSEKLSGNITSDYEDSGIVVEDILNGWNWIKRFIRNSKGVLFSDTFGGSSNTYYKSAFNGMNSTGVRCPWRFGNLYSGANAGLAYGNGSAWPGGSYWYGRPRLSGAGKKRGEWHVNT